MVEPRSALTRRATSLRAGSKESSSSHGQAFPDAQTSSTSRRFLSFHAVTPCTGRARGLHSAAHMVRRTALPFAFAAAATLIGGSAYGHQLRGYVSQAGLDFISEQVPALVPKDIYPDPISKDIACMTATQRNTHVALEVHDFAITIPQEGRLRLYLNISADGDGELNVDDAYACFGEMTCQDQITSTTPAATIDFDIMIDGGKPKAVLPERRPPAQRGRHRPQLLRLRRRRHRQLGHRLRQGVPDRHAAREGRGHGQGHARPQGRGDARRRSAPSRARSSRWTSPPHSQDLFVKQGGIDIGVDVGSELDVRAGRVRRAVSTRARRRTWRESCPTSARWRAAGPGAQLRPGQQRPLSSRGARV